MRIGITAWVGIAASSTAGGTKAKFDIHFWWLSGAAMRDTAKLFRSGRSQAVRLPKEFRFDGDEVRIRREGQRVVLEPMKIKSKSGDWTWLDELSAKLPKDFFDSVGAQEAPEERLALKRVFP